MIFYYKLYQRYYQEILYREIIRKYITVDKKIYFNMSNLEKFVLL